MVNSLNYVYPLLSLVNYLYTLLSLVDYLNTLLSLIRRAGFGVEAVRVGDDLDNWVSSHGHKNGEKNYKENHVNLSKGSSFDIGFVFRLFRLG